jgi:hypothetical protein
MASFWPIKKQPGKFPPGCSKSWSDLGQERPEYSPLQIRKFILNTS